MGIAPEHGAPDNAACKPCSAVPVSGKPLRSFLQTGNELIPQAERLLALRRAVERSLPANLRTAAQVANLKGGTLILHAGGNAVAAKLKHCTASLVEALAREGYHVASIKVEVQPDCPVPARPRTVRPLPAGAAEGLRRLEQELPADSELRRVIAALAAKPR